MWFPVDSDSRGTALCASLGTGTADECLIRRLRLLFGGCNDEIPPEPNICLTMAQFYFMSRSFQVILSLFLSITLKTWLTKASLLNGLRGEESVIHDGLVSRACFYWFPLASMLFDQRPSGRQGIFNFLMFSSSNLDSQFCNSGHTLESLSCSHHQCCWQISGPSQSAETLWNLKRLQFLQTQVADPGI